MVPIPEKHPNHVSNLFEIFNFTAVLEAQAQEMVYEKSGLTSFHDFLFLKFIVLIVRCTKTLSFTCRKFVSQVVTGYLPNLILLVFLKIVPPVMEFLSSIQGYISHSDIQKSACNKVLWFMIWNIFFATVFSGSVLYQLNIVLDPKNIPARLGVAVPAQVRIIICADNFFFNFYSI